MTRGARSDPQPSGGAGGGAASGSAARMVNAEPRLADMRIMTDVAPQSTSMADQKHAADLVDGALVELNYDQYLSIAAVLDVVAVLRAEADAVPAPTRTDLPLTI